MISVFSTVIAGGDPNAAEADPVGDTGTFILYRDGRMNNDFTVDLSYSGSATYDGDYSVSHPLSVDFVAWQTEATITVTAIDDLDYDPGEDVRITISPNPNIVVGYGAGTAVIDIIDDEIFFRPELTIATGDPFWEGGAADPLPVATEGIPYTLVLETVSGLGPYEYTLVDPGTGDLPDGLLLSSDGVITGTPAAGTGGPEGGPGITYNFTVHVADTNSSIGLTGEKDFALTVNPPGGIFLTGSLPPATVGVPYTDAAGFEVQLEVAGIEQDETTFSIVSGTLPPGLYMNALFVPVNAQATILGEIVTDSHWGFYYLAGPIPSIASVNPPDGTWEGGTTVVITGSNFPTSTVKQDAIDNTKVEFGGTIATVVDIIDNGDGTFGGTEITVVTSRHSPPELVDVRVTDLGTNGAGDREDAYTYTGPNAPIVAVIDPSQASTDGWVEDVGGVKDYTVTITGDYFDLNPSVYLARELPDGATISDITGTAVTGLGTQFERDVRVGGYIMLETDGLWYEVAAIADDWNLTLVNPFAGIHNPISPVHAGVALTGVALVPDVTHFTSTIAVVEGGTAGVYDRVVGAGTNFTAYVSPGDFVRVGAGPWMRVELVNSATVLTLREDQGAAVPAGTWDVTPDETLTGEIPDLATLPFEPLEAGLSDVWVVNEDLMWGCGAELFAFSGLPCTVDVVHPRLGPETGGTTITIEGSGFVADPKPAVRFGAVAATAVNVAGDGLSLTCTAPSGVAWTSVEVSVTNDNSLAAVWDGQFTYTAAPSLTDILPSLTDAGDTVTITGNYFWQDTIGLWALTSPPEVKFGDKVSPTVTVATDGGLVSSITAVVPAQDAGFTGYVDITVTNPDGQSGMLWSAFSYFTTTPLIGDIEPDAAGSGEWITIEGAGFQPGVQVFFDPGLPALPQLATSFWVSDGLISVLVPPGTGTVDVIVTNPSGGTSTSVGAFSYVARVTSVTPSHGPVRGGTTVTIRGNNFEAGLTIELDADIVPLADITWISPTEVEFVTPDVRLSFPSAGWRDVIITNPLATDSTVLEDAFYYDGIPVITQVPVAHGTYMGAMIDVLGDHFQEGFTAEFGGVPCPFAYRGSIGWVTLKAPDQPTGTACYITITNPDGESCSSEFTVPAPIVFTYD